MKINKKILLAGAALVVSGFAYTNVSHAFDMTTLQVIQNDATKQGYMVVNGDRSSGAQDFIQNMAKRGIGFLANPDLTLEQRKAEFKDLLQSSFDIKAIGRFTMGRYWSGATAEQKAEFQKLFEDMIIESYSRRFSDYDGQDFDVTSTRSLGKSDTIVQSYITDTNGQKISVDWRVREKNGGYKVIDIIVEGVSMATTQRSEFASIIQRGGGDVQVLITHLKG